MQSSYGVNTGYLFLRAPSSLPDRVRAKCSENRTICFVFFKFIHIMLWRKQQSTQLLLRLTEIRQKTSWPYCLQYFPQAVDNLTKRSCQTRFTMPGDKKMTVFMNAIQNKGTSVSHWDSTQIWDKCLFQCRRLIVKCQPNTHKGKAGDKLVFGRWTR